MRRAEAVDPDFVIRDALMATGHGLLYRVAKRYQSIAPEQAVDAMLEQFGLGAYRDRQSGLLPEGTRKLLDIAMAMVVKPRILLLYGSLRERSYSRFLTMEAAQLLEAFGAETRIFNPSGLPLPDDAPSDHPKVQELREWIAEETEDLP
jgi:hypothetical protein